MSPTQYTGSINRPPPAAPTQDGRTGGSHAEDAQSCVGRRGSAGGASVLPPRREGPPQRHQTGSDRRTMGRRGIPSARREVGGGGDGEQRDGARDKRRRDRRRKRRRQDRRETEFETADGERKDGDGRRRRRSQETVRDGPQTTVRSGGLQHHTQHNRRTHAAAYTQLAAARLRSGTAGCVCVVRLRLRSAEAQTLSRQWI